jgi:hypothetical protein
MLLLVGHAVAIRPTPANYSNNLITSTVDAFCIGTYTVNHEMVWKQTSDDRGFGNNPIAPGESQVDYAYRENTLGYEGTSTYIKDFSMNGGNVQQGMDNLNVNHIIDFENSPNKNGLLHFEEMARMDIYGAADSDQNGPICIFASGSSSGEGAYKGFVTVGSQMDVREVSARTSIGSSSISDNPNTPVNLRYTFDAEGLATSDVGHAVGTATVYSNVDMHIYNTYHEICANAADPTNTTGCENYNGSAAPGTTVHIQDRQDQTMRGIFDLSTTYMYGGG